MLAVVPETFVCSVPPRYTPYPATPTASVDPFHESETTVAAEPLFVSPLGAEGGVESPPGAQALVAAVSVVLAESLPAASYAVTAKSYDVPQASPATVNLVRTVVPAAVPS